MIASIKTLSGDVYPIQVEDGSAVSSLRDAIASVLRVPTSHIRLFKEDGQEALDQDVVQESYCVWIEAPAVVGGLVIRVVDNELTFKKQENCNLLATAFRLIAREQEFTRDVVEQMKVSLWEMDYRVEGLSLMKLIELYFQVFFPKVKVVGVILH